MKHTKSKEIIKSHYCYQMYRSFLSKDLSKTSGVFQEKVDKRYHHCLDMMERYQGKDLKVLSPWWKKLEFAFFGEINGKQAFFRITKRHDRYIYIEELPKGIYKTLP